MEHAEHVRTAEREKLRTKAERIAWRQLFRWTQVQMAMVEMGMAATDEVFLPYLEAGDEGQSLCQLFQAHEAKLLAASTGT